MIADKIRRVMWGREEHPATVFVPWDCGHRCPFCTTKAEYETKYPREKLDYYFSRQKESLRRLLEYGFVDDLVFTGGEPLADIKRLNELIDIAASRCKVYINTTLNLDGQQQEEAFEFLSRECGGPRVTGISVSIPYADASMMNARGYDMIGRLMRECGHMMPYNWLRVNSVVLGDESAEQIRKFVKDIISLERGKGHGIWAINLRKDYTKCTQANLNDWADPTMQTLLSMEDMPYKGHGGCFVCRNDVFWPNGDMMHRLVYHRGVESTSIRSGDLMVINDIVVKQDGEIRYDWIEGTQLPKCVMDTLARPQHTSEAEWKWKNPLFSHSVKKWGYTAQMTCRDQPGERCG